MRDWRNQTPLKRYCQEIKCHESMINFNRNLKSDIQQAITQAPANKNWQLVTWHPGLEIDLVVMDYKDYLCNDIIGQQAGNKKNLCLLWVK